MKKRLILSAALSAALGLSTYAQPISPTFFGHNAWMPDTIGNVNNCPGGIIHPCYLDGRLYETWPQMQDAGIRFIRYAGINHDINGPTDFQYKRVLSKAKEHGIEAAAVIIPYDDANYNTSNATDIVNKLKGQYPGLIYIIGNEPNTEYSVHKYARHIGAYIKSFSTAIKNADPTAKVMGPELSFYDPVIIDSLFNTSFSDYLTGLDGSGRPYIDIFSYHTYPFTGSQNRADVIGKPGGSFKDKLGTLASKCSTANVSRGAGKELLFAVTEFNLNTLNPSPNNIDGVGASSFLAGQYIAEMLSEGMRLGTAFMNPWSMVEGDGPRDLGFIDENTLKKRPEYIHYSFVANNFSGNYLPGFDTLVSAGSGYNNVKVFGSKDAAIDRISVIILNQDSYPAAKKTFALRLNNSAISATGKDLKLRVNAGVNIEILDEIENETTMLYVFDLSGNVKKKCKYRRIGTKDSLNCGVCPPDLVIRDNAADNGWEPNPHSGSYWESPEIWCRNLGNGGSYSETHEDPDSRPVTILISMHLLKIPAAIRSQAK